MQTTPSTETPIPAALTAPELTPEPSTEAPDPVYTTPTGEIVLAPIVGQPVRVLDADLTKDQRIARAGEGEELLAEADRLEEELKAHATEVKNRAKVALATARIKLRAARSGVEPQDVLCVERLDWQARKIRTVRTDTGKEVDARTLPEHELREHYEEKPDFDRKLMVATCKHTGRELRAYSRRLTDEELQQSLPLAVRVWFAEDAWEAATQAARDALEKAAATEQWGGEVGYVIADVTDVKALDEVRRLAKVYALELHEGPTAPTKASAEDDDRVPFGNDATAAETPARRGRNKPKGRTAEARG